MGASPWAILLCTFSDTADLVPPFDDAFFEDLFTTSGNGTFNMVDYFLDSSHGSVDIGASRIFGWFPLDQKRADYQGSGANPEGRKDLLKWAKAKAAQRYGDSFTAVASHTLVCMNIETDLFGGPSGTVCDIAGLAPSLLGQEMGHVYGLDHSRLEGSDEDYRDEWDTMSNRTSNMAHHDRWGEIGPGLNAANMASRDWLDSARTAVVRDDTALIKLRPLHRRDLPGTLAARVGDYYVEFRAKAGWDAEIGQPTVLVHQLVGNHSYLMLNTKGSPELVKGTTFEKGHPASEHTRIEVTDIDPEQETATVAAHHLTPVPLAQGPAIDFSGLVSAGGGGLVWVNGKFVQVPPHSPAIKLLEHVAMVAEADAVAIPHVRDMMRREAYRAVGQVAEAALTRIDGFRTPSALRSDR